ncbi:MAG: hypothetical protein CBC47_07150 [Alphaproteobacteria bacterium TMED87]|nr:hypothetical protein [Rhodospirillaceae bacterium]OUV08627.1 MAG: hypothetical protein CBC47_07150 [Alphaproteobacteria bacterium TMED87]
MKFSIIKKIKSKLKEDQFCAVLTDIESGNQIFIDHKKDIAEVENENTKKHLTLMLGAGISGLVKESNFFLKVYGPIYKMILVGSVHISQYLVPMSKLVGFKVIVIDPREFFINSYQMPDIEVINEWPDEVINKIGINSRTAVITLTHDSKLDDPTLITALNSECFYIGALGSRKTHQKRTNRLLKMGIKPENLERISGPVGLDINAQSPQEIAVSILAEVIQKKQEVN